MIDNIKLNGVNAVKTTKSDGHTPKSAMSHTRAAEGDQLQISLPSSLLDAALSTPTPDQQEKIAGIKAAIQQGNYEIDLESLAEAVIKHYS
jgi:flagellar biosynthesis anti-sigma factor FlgM